MLQITPQMKILVAVEPADFRRGIDGLARLCQQTLQEDPFAGTVFVFRNRRGTALKVLMYDGQGFWLCHKRLSQGLLPLVACGRGGQRPATGGSSTSGPARGRRPYPHRHDPRLAARGAVRLIPAPSGTCRSAVALLP